MADGIGCTCAAWSANECCCGVDWTPKELIELREQLAALTEENAELKKTLTWVPTQETLSLQLAAMTTERDIAKHNEQCTHNANKLMASQLFASQAREQQMREALEDSNALNINWVSVAEPDMLEHLPEYRAVIKMGTEALALLQDDTALKAWGAKLLREIAQEMENSRCEDYEVSVLRRKADELDQQSTK